MMLSGLLAAVSVGPIELIIILGVLAIPGLVMIKFFRYIRQSTRERIRLHQKIAELNEEIKELRKEKGSE